MGMCDVTWLLTMISLTGTVFNIKKKIICFYIWLVGDLLWMTFDLVSGMYGRAFLDFIQMILAIAGILEWRREEKLNANRKNRNIKIKSGEV